MSGLFISRAVIPSKPIPVILSEAKNLLQPGAERFFGLRPQNDIGVFSESHTLFGMTETPRQARGRQ